jgi:hypothetical protein
MLYACPHYLNEPWTGKTPLRGRRRAGAHPPDQSTAVPVGVPAQGRGGTPDPQPVPAGDQADQVRACAALKVALLCMGQWAITQLYFAVSSLVLDATARGSLANVARKSDVHWRTWLFYRCINLGYIASPCRAQEAWNSHDQQVIAMLLNGESLEAGRTDQASETPSQVWIP